MKTYILKTLPVGQMRTNCYLLIDQPSQTAIIIDPGEDADYIITILQDLHVVPLYLIATHGHFDHILGAWQLQQTFSIPFYIHKADQFLVTNMKKSAEHFLSIPISEIPPRVDKFLSEDQKIKIGNDIVSVIETPGHTPGSVSLYFEPLKLLFTGDTLFAQGGVGRTDFSYSSKDKLNTSIDRILKYNMDTMLYPGHGIETNVATELKNHGIDNSS